jgi:hypothetical protein
MAAGLISNERREETIMQIQNNEPASLTSPDVPNFQVYAISCERHKMGLSKMPPATHGFMLNIPSTLLNCFMAVSVPKKHFFFDPLRSYLHCK